MVTSVSLSIVYDNAGDAIYALDVDTEPEAHEPTAASSHAGVVPAAATSQNSDDPGAAVASQMSDAPDSSPEPPPMNAQEPKPLPDVKMPSAAKIARHSLTHLPFRRWCRWCSMARKPNIGHFKLPPFSRSTPMLVMD